MNYKPWLATHIKTGNVYEVIGEAIDATNETRGRTIVIYTRDGATYVRDVDEFMDKFTARESK